jgi:hypothetical protein
VSRDRVFFAALLYGVSGTPGEGIVLSSTINVAALNVESSLQVWKPTVPAPLGPSPADQQNVVLCASPPYASSGVLQEFRLRRCAAGNFFRVDVVCFVLYIIDVI